MLFSSDDGLAKAYRVDLQGTPLSSPPNPTVQRHGNVPVILNVTTPNLQIRRAQVHPSKGTILLFPGGGYHVLAIEHEGVAVADLLNKCGFDVAILEYSIGNEPAIRAKALSDATAALNLLQKRGVEMGINTTSLGVMGFSAGGHLAAHLVHELGSSSPLSMTILIYPAYLDAPGGLQPDVTPPTGTHSKTFVLIGEKDKPEWVSSAAVYAQASKANGQMSEYHLLPGTGHGFGLKIDQKPPISDWPLQLELFLKGCGS